MRYERKYRIEDLSIDAVKQMVRHHPAVFEEIYPIRKINNIYFDTPGLTTYKDNVMGIANRKKIRVRWYGYLTERVIDPKLEIKMRFNEVGVKQTYSVADFELDDLTSLTKEVNLLANETSLSPILINSYHRSYWGTKDKKYRLTIDWQMAFSSIYDKIHFTANEMFDRDTVILELKYDRELELEADFIAQFIPYRRTKNSKYVNGVQLCLGQ